MKTIAMVNDGVVANLAKWDGVPSEEFTLVDVTDISVGIGWAVVDGAFVAPVVVDKTL